jgi:hypothetical protein
MRHFLWVICTIGTPTLAQAQDNQEIGAWAVRISRVEGAAEDVRRAAEDLEETSFSISTSGNLRDLVQFENQLDTLNRLVISARMAIDVAAEDLTSN